MGQAYLLVNLSKKQFINPHKFGNGYKIMEFGASGESTMMALAILLSNGNGRGGGDLDSKDPIVGSWAGDKIVIAGDYGDEGKFLPRVSTKKLTEIAKDSFSEGYQQPERVNLYHFAEHEYEDISVKVLAALMDEEWTRKQLENAAQESGFDTFKEAIKEAKLLKKLVA
jgi:hypothetical protein